MYDGAPAIAKLAAAGASRSAATLPNTRCNATGRMKPRRLPARIGGDLLAQEVAPCFGLVLRRSFLLSRAFFVFAGWAGTKPTSRDCRLDGWQYTPIFAFWFDAQPIQGKWVVTESSVPHLSLGTIISRINGRPTDDFVRDIEDESSIGSRSGDADGLAFRFTWLFPRTLNVSTQDGRTIAIRARHSTSDPIEKLNSSRPVLTKTFAHDVGYIRIFSFSSPTDERAALAAVHHFAQSQAIIVDVRGNQGGSTPTDLIESLLNTFAPWWKERSTIRRPQQFTYAPSQNHYRGRLVVIINNGCRSACEDFVMPLKWTKRAVLVGETTGGSTGQPFVRALSNGMFYQIGATHVWFPDGSRFEGVGIAPNITAPKTLNDVVRHRDSVLDAALDAAQRSR